MSTVTPHISGWWQLDPNVSEPGFNFSPRAQVDRMERAMSQPQAQPGPPVSSGVTWSQPLLSSAAGFCLPVSPPVSPQFVLKHEALAHLREVALFPNTLNPHEAESLALVGAMISQVMELHPGARWLHVGCDEVSPSMLLPPLSLAYLVCPSQCCSSPSSSLQGFLVPPVGYFLT